MKELKQFKGVIIFFLILTVINFIPLENGRTAEYVQGDNEVHESDVAANI